MYIATNKSELQKFWEVQNLQGLSNIAKIELTFGLEQKTANALERGVKSLSSKNIIKYHSTVIDIVCRLY